MKRFGLIILSLFCCGPAVSADTYRAFSMNAARKSLATGVNERHVTQVAGITRPVALVYDARRRDIILVGRTGDEQPLTLDDWAVAVRASLKHRQDPGVSIDRTEQTSKTGMQTVRLSEGLARSQFGLDFLAADVTLKGLGLGSRSAGIFGVRSYFDLSVDEWKKTGSQTDILSRFWFVPQRSESYVTVRKDSYVIVEEYRIGVRNQLMGAKGQVERDPPAEQFSSSLEASFPDLAAAFPELARLEQLFYISALAQGLEGMGVSDRSEEIAFWLHDYRPKMVDVPKQWKLEKSSRRLPDGKELSMTMSGGIHLEALVIDLQDGVADSLKHYVLTMRPEEGALSWDTPLLELFWGSSHNIAQVDAIAAQETTTDIGMNLLREVHPTATVTSSTSNQTSFVPLGTQTFPTPGLTDAPFRGTSHRRTSDIGGVMLDQTASVSGIEASDIQLGKGSFSLVLGQDDARANPKAFRRFVTALWAVYFGRTDPGISIDPIAPGNEQQFVRYINSMYLELGAVMRVADYTMKQWAVGAERPNLQNFMNPDDYAAKNGVMYLGAMSRFWFLPQDMRFKATGNGLIFDSGKMTLKTEFMMNNARGLRADPANEAFARWFTDSYEEIAKRYPVYQELFDYAKLVSLSRFLVENNVPLYWFLMANRDLVLTEDSPGTVPTLSESSKHFEGVRIEGGVEMTSKSEYVMDRSARDAIAEAYRGLSTTDLLKTSLSDLPRYVSKPVSMAMGDKDYTIVPQHTSSSGKDGRGLRYQTDISIRAKGYVLSRTARFALRPVVHRRELWDILRPNLEGLSEEELQDRFDGLYDAAWESAELRTERILAKLELLEDKEYVDEGRFMQDVEFRIGKGPVTRLGDVIVENARYDTRLDLVRYFDPRRRQEHGDFGPGWRLLIPYRLRAYGKETREFVNVNLPTKMTLEDRLGDKHEVLAFHEADDEHPDAGYYPPNEHLSKHVAVFVLTNGNFELEDKIGSKYIFDGAGRLITMMLSDDHVVSIEYLDSASEDFERPPFVVEPDTDGETVTFSGESIAKSMRIVDAHGAEEVLTFGDLNNIVGWVPSDPENSRFKILATMSDRSYMLLDEHANEFAFDATGRFVRFIPGGEEVVRSMGIGRHRVSFKHALDPNGRIAIDGAWVARDARGASPLYVVDYEYDKDYKLASRTVQTSGGEQVFAVLQ